MKRKMTAFAALTAASALLAGCAEKQYVSYEMYAMDTFISFAAKDAGTSDLAAAADTVSDIENTLSRTREGSEIYILGHASEAEVSEKTAGILREAFAVSEASDGAFNPCLGAVSALWDFTGTPYVPSDEELVTLLTDTDIGSVVIDGTNVVKAHEGTVIDLGACAKGYTAEAVADVFRERGIRDAMIDIGGNIAVIGESPRGGLWNVGIKNPFSPDTILGYVPCTDTVIAVSGAYERYFEQGGVRYHHILDPDTGRPVSSGLFSVAVFCEDGLICDALSTALFVMGKEKALAFYQKHIYDFEAILVTDGGEVTVTDGLFERFVRNENAAGADGKPLAFIGMTVENT